MPADQSCAASSTASHRNVTLRPQTWFELINHGRRGRHVYRPVPPTRFLHTADWHLGLRVNFIPGDAGAIVRNERFATFRRIGTVAHETQSEFVVPERRQFIEHAPGPRGSPQRPQADGAASELDLPTAMRENRTRSVSVAAHTGHAGTSPGDDSSSKG